MDKITVMFEYIGSTPKKFEYKEIPTGAMEILHAKPTLIIGKLCIQKWVLGNQPPTRLTLTITPGKGSKK